MSIQPIDLQTLFLKMSQVGKDQAVEKDSITLQQSLQGHEIAKRNLHSDNSVNKANNSDSGPEKTKEDKEQSSAKNQGKEKKEKNKTAENKEILSDPDLGKNIDFSG